MIGDDPKHYPKSKHNIGSKSRQFAIWKELFDTNVPSSNEIQKYIIRRTKLLRNAEA